MADDKHLVCFGATVYCNKSQSCNNPGSAVPLNITSQTLVVINGGKLAATNKDNTVANMNFGACSARHNAPCSAQVEWTKFYQNADVAGTLKLLTEESEGLCTCGGGKIKIAKHGQVATPQSIEMEEVSLEILGQILPINTKKPDIILQDAAIYGNVMSYIEPEVISGWWTDENDKKIDKALLTDKVRYHIATKGIANGSVVYVTIWDEDSPIPDDYITTAPITVNDNKGYAEILLKQDWNKYIESDGGDEIELYGECKYNGQSKEFDDTKGVLNVYAVGYIANDNCRIRIIPKIDGIDPPQIIYTKGIIELDIDNLTFPTRYAWNNAGRDSNNWTDKDIGGLSKELSYVCIIDSNSEFVGINNDSTDPNANDTKIYNTITNPGYKKDTPRLKGNYYTGHTVGWQRSAGAGLILAVNAINAVVKYGFIYCQDYDNNKIKKHYNILQNVLNIVGEKINTINEKYRTWHSYYYIVNIVLRGENLSGNTELFEIAKKIYRESTNDYEKE